MYQVLSALVAGRNDDCYSSSERVKQLLRSACCLIASAPSAIIRSTSVYAAAPSLEEAQWLADFAHELAAEHGLLALVEFGDGRLRVKFQSLPAASGVLRGG
jgi:hypothetical protein